MAQEVRTSLSPKTVLKGQLLYRLNFASLLNLSESDFAKMIAEIEKDPLVRKLMNPANSGLKALTKKRFPNARLSSGFCEIDERVQGSPKTVDVESLLARRQGLADLIRRIGQENFEKHFLSRGETGTLEASAKDCGISVDEARKIESLLLDISIHSEFFHPSALPAEGGIRYTLIAKIEREGGKITVSFLSPHLAAGRYMIHRDRIESVKKTLEPGERKKLKAVLDKIELINLRQDTLQKILSLIISAQDSFLRSGEAGSKVPITQKTASERLKLSPSTISRAIFGKSVNLPWNQEVPLQDLFLNKKDAAEQWVKEILSSLPPEKRKKISDRRLMELLFEKHKLKASRRAVNLYRRAVREKSA